MAQIFKYTITNNCSWAITRVTLTKLLRKVKTLLIQEIISKVNLNAFLFGKLTDPLEITKGDVFPFPHLSPNFENLFDHNDLLNHYLNRDKVFIFQNVLSSQGSPNSPGSFSKQFPGHLKFFCVCFLAWIAKTFKQSQHLARQLCFDSREGGRGNPGVPLFPPPTLFLKSWHPLGGKLG